MSLKFFLFLGLSHVISFHVYWIRYISRFPYEPEMYFGSGLKRLDSRCIFTQFSLTCSSPNVKEQTHQPIVSLKVLYFNSESALLLCSIDVVYRAVRISKSPSIKGESTFVSSLLKVLQLRCFEMCLFTHFSNTR